MIAAIYARKSTDQSAVADEAKSVTRQIEHASAYAERKGWTVSAEHVFADDGISGAEFAGRPSFVRLMNALRPRAPFQVLIMSEESRLGREAIETAYALKQLITGGVRVFFYLEDRERTFDSPTDKLLMSVTAFADELERQKAALRVYDAMQRKAHAGHVCGGRVFGYDNLEVLGANGERSHVERRINEGEASIVRRIFELSAGGYGQTRIAKTLNADGVPAPRAQQGRPVAWAPSTVREVLKRPLYRGQIVWNRTKKRDSWGQKRRKARPAAEWLTSDAEALRIVDEPLWLATQARLRDARDVYLRGTKGRLWGRPPRGAESKYLLPGLGRCALCNGSIYVKSKDHGKKKAYFYGCTSYHLRGQSVCTNGIEVPMETANRVILDNFADLLQPAVINAAIERTLQRAAAAPQEAAARRRTVEARLGALETEIARYTAAIGAGGELSSLVAVLQAREAQRSELQAEMRRLSGVRVPNFTEARKDLESRLVEWRELLTRHVPQGRQLLKKLLSGPIRFTPVQEGIRCGWEFSGTATLAKLLTGTVFANMVTSPEGFVRRGHAALQRVLRPARRMRHCFVGRLEGHAPLYRVRRAQPLRAARVGRRLVLLDRVARTAVMFGVVCGTVAMWEPQRAEIGVRRNPPSSGPPASFTTGQDVRVTPCAGKPARGRVGACTPMADQSRPESKNPYASLSCDRSVA